MLIKNGTVVTSNGEIEASILIEEKKIVRISNDIDVNNDVKVIDAKNKLIFPGFIDLHVHGAMGVDICDDNPDLSIFNQFQVQHGTTSLLLTTRTMTNNKTEKVVKNLNHLIKIFSSDKRLNILGIHLEGPFLNEEFRGAQAKEHIQVPSIATFKRWNEI